MKRVEANGFMGSWQLYSSVGLIILIGVVVGVLLIFEARSERPAHQKLTLSNKKYSLELADTAAKRTHGLSDRSDLNKNTAMLFVFPDTTQQCMWMKDMSFSLDMVWLNENKEIIKIAENVMPETYPKTFCAEDTKYVLEFAAGEAEDLNLVTGQRLKF